MAYHDGQPFNENHAAALPHAGESGEAPRDALHRTGAHSTDLQSPESVEHLTEKTEPYARNWTPSADELWQCSHNCAACAGHPEEK